jgi:hypothetical protein
MIIFTLAFLGAFTGTFLPLFLVYLVIKKNENSITTAKKNALEELVQARKAAMDKVQSNIHDAIVTGKIKTMGSQSKLYPFDDDDDGDKGSGSFN